MPAKMEVEKIYQPEEEENFEAFMGLAEDSPDEEDVINSQHSEDRILPIENVFSNETERIISMISTKLSTLENLKSFLSECEFFTETPFGKIKILSCDLVVEQSFNLYEI